MISQWSDGCRLKIRDGHFSTVKILQNIFALDISLYSAKSMCNSLGSDEVRVTALWIRF